MKNLRSDKFHKLTSSQSGFGQVTTSLTPVLFLNGTKGSPYFIGLQRAVCKSLCNMLTVTSSLRNMVSRSQGWGRSESGSGWMPKWQQQNTLTDFKRQEIFLSVITDVGRATELLEMASEVSSSVSPLCHPLVFRLASC